MSNETLAVVPLPRKGSRIVSLSFEVPRMNGLISFSGNVAECSRFLSGTNLSDWLSVVIRTSSSMKSFGTLPNGSKYVGEFKDGKPNGQGTDIFVDGSKGIGEFREGRPWNITHRDKNGNIIVKFVNGKQIKQ